MPVMRRSLPSLNALRAFEAAARHVSFTAAAEELHVSQAAVSRFVRLLEESVGIALFQRRPNGLTLTDAGQFLATGTSHALDRIEELVRDTQERGQSRQVLTVGVGPTLATRWLIPRLGRFTLAHPSIEIRVATGGAVAPFNEEWTCAIRLGQEPWPGFTAERLFTADLVLVCAPTIAKRLDKPSDLAGVPLLRVRHALTDWPRWSAAAGLPNPLPAQRQGGPLFDTYGLALQAAADGLGAALAMKAYVAADIAVGSLVSPFPITVPKGDAWYLIHRPGKAGNASLQAFGSWLKDEIAAAAAPSDR